MRIHTETNTRTADAVLHIDASFKSINKQTCAAAVKPIPVLT